jgi:arginyl-tRNA synthetase
VSNAGVLTLAGSAPILEGFETTFGTEERVYLILTNRLREALGRHIREKYGVELTIVLERPPKLEMGEAASPVCFELAKRLKRAPRQIAQEIAASLAPIPGISRVDVAGGGYLNAFFDRSAFWKRLSGEKNGKGQRRDAESAEGRRGAAKIIVEHTSINPNKAAHIGHVRNAVLGDTLARILRHDGEQVQVQNYIDNTGVQVADVVIGFLHLEKRTPVNVKMLAREPRFDYYCWDLYTRATHFFAEDKERATKLRGETLRAIEEGRGEEAETAGIVADAIVTSHLRTMARIEIEYDLLARESEILHLKFWDAAFELLKKSGAIQFVTAGKMAGCWVMPWKKEVEEGKEVNEVKDKGKTDGNTTQSTEATEEEEENSQDKIIVRSNGTVTYVGKDIAYQLWKFGLLGKDFHYRRWPEPPSDKPLWTTTTLKDDPAAPHFGEPAARVYNVIDTRQSYLQDVVAAGLRALGHPKEAENSIHFSYEVVSLTPRCAQELGYELSAEEAKRGTIEVSGRKGLGVKADDLIDKLEAATLAEVAQRHPEMPELERKTTAHAIAVSALRFFLLKYTRNAIIAFDFQDALSFEGETGPYCQYAVVRARGIWRKGAELSPDLTSEKTIRGAAKVLEIQQSPESARFLSSSEGQDLWELVMLAGSLDYATDAAINGQEPAFMAKYAFQLAQAFNNFYHKHHILTEADEQKRAFLLALTELVEAQLVRALSLLGISCPEKM